MAPRRTLKAKGPASAATDPDHGSTIPEEETAMNKPNDATRPVDPAMPSTVAGFYDAVSHIEYSLADVRSMAAVASYLAEDMPGGKPDADALVPSSLVDLLTFTVYQTERMLKVVQADWEKANKIGFELRGTA